MSTHDLITHDDHLRALAMAVARNRAGPEDPIDEVLLRENIAPSDFDSYLNDGVFKKYVTAFTHELKENGFSFAAKCRILAEDAIQHMYAMTRDTDVPAAARVKAVENLVTWSGLAAKTATDVAVGTGFHITFNIPGGIVAPAARVIEAAPASSMTMTFNAPAAKPTPVIADDAEIEDANVITSVRSAESLLTMADVFPELDTAHDHGDDAYE
jgi:hypothetical protein